MVQDSDGVGDIDPQVIVDVTPLEEGLIDEGHLPVDQVHGDALLTDDEDVVDGAHHLAVVENQVGHGTDQCRIIDHIQAHPGQGMEAVRRGRDHVVREGRNVVHHRAQLDPFHGGGKVRIGLGLEELDGIGPDRDLGVGAQDGGATEGQNGLVIDKGNLPSGTTMKCPT